MIKKKTQKIGSRVLNSGFAGMPTLNCHRATLKPGRVKNNKKQKKTRRNSVRFDSSFFSCFYSALLNDSK